MPSKLELINRVLSEVGKLPVSKIEDSEAGEYLSAKIEELHPELLLAYNWPWGIVYRKDSTPLVTNYSPDYHYSYQLPADFGKFYKWASTGAQFALYAFVDGMLLANTNPIQYYYISSQVPFEVVPPLYARALVLYVASQSSLFLTNNVQLTGYLDKKYTDAMTRAILQADMERSVMSTPFNDFDRVLFV